MSSNIRSSAYVNPATCAECHADVADSYRRTGMSHSMYKPASGTMVEDFAQKNAVFHQPSGNYYTMVQHADGYYQQRHQAGFDGKPADVMEERIDYVIGSGDHARSYLHKTLEGRLMELPITWYSEKNGYWAMSPGYDAITQKDFHGTISKDCIFCHDAYPATEVMDIETSREPIFNKQLPMGIDCQRCHGPGGAHEKAARAAKPDEKLVVSSIVNPASLSRERKMEVCMECHLSTSASQEENISLRSDRDIFSYRPGQPLPEYKLYFDSSGPQKKDGFSIPDAAYRLRMSSCFRSSQMTCLTCHDPHNQLHGHEAQEHYLKVCKHCHQAVKHTVALPANENCVSCHMPKRRGEYAIHIVLTDHYIQRSKPTRDLLADVVAKNGAGKGDNATIALYYPEKLPDGSKAELDIASAEASNGNDTASVSRLEKAVARYSPAQPNYYLVLGRAYMRKGDPQHASAWFEQAIEREPKNHDAVGDLVESLIASGKLDQAQAALEKIVTAPPADGRLVANLGNIYARRGDLEKAESTLRRALEINPELAPAYQLLGMVKERLGDTASAEELYRSAIRYRPDLPEAHIDLAKLLMASGRYQEANFNFKQAIAGAPRIADAHHNRALLLMLMKSYPEAETELHEAIDLEPSQAISHSDMADLLVQMKRQDQASQQYRQALVLEPTLGEANLGLGLLLMKRGEKEQGRKYCEKAALNADASIAKEARRCLQP